MTDGVVIKDASYPASIAGAVIDTALAIGQLGKDEENKFGKYNYVPIDKYYEMVAQIALQHDLTWTCKEAQSRIEDSDKFIIKFQYLFSLIHRDGSVVPAADTISIYHQFQGAQTSGSAASYAEKLFMRKLFKVVTGEQDADATDPNFADRDPADPNVYPVGSSKNEPVSMDDLDFDLDTENPDKPKNIQEKIKDSGLVVVPNVGQEERDAKDEAEERAAIVAIDKEPDADLGEVPDPSTDDGGDDLTQYVEKEEDGLKIIGKIDKPDEEKWNIVLAAFTAWMPDLTQADQVTEWWNKNHALLEDMEDKAPTIHKKITRLFKTSYTKLEKKNA